MQCSGQRDVYAVPLVRLRSHLSTYPWRHHPATTRRSHAVLQVRNSSGNVVIVGGGVGGLATAGRLAKQGLHVTVFEKNDEVKLHFLSSQYLKRHWSQIMQCRSAPNRCGIHLQNGEIWVTSDVNSNITSLSFWAAGW
jgi:heterodisulfide reductase subunit A-like polyferredoxin